MTIWSKRQLAVFDNVANGTGNTVIKAVAGSGKTTTIVEALKHVPPALRALFVAFNKGIAEELAKRAPPGVEVSTLHSYGLKTITRNLGRLRIENYRVDGLLLAMRNELEIPELIRKIMLDAGAKPTEDQVFGFDLRRDFARTVSLAKGFLASEEEQIDLIIDSFEIGSADKSPVPMEDTSIIRAAFIRDVLAVLLRCADVSDGQIDFDDMIWLPIVLNLKQSQFDRVFVDETQDLNRAQVEMTLRAVKPGGRICAVGDPRQAIYGFRGADSGAMENLVTRLEATVLPLSVCYRCCKEVIREAQKTVPEIEWAPDAVDGEVLDSTPSEMKKNAKPGDFILSRTNAPLVSLCMHFLREGRPATIQGRDIGASLAAFIKKSKAKDVDALCDYVEEWRNKECLRLAAKHRDTQAVEDRAECILTLSEGAALVAEVIGRVESLFADKDDQSRIVLSTTHKAKGMERDRVWLLSSTYGRREGVEEENLYYVAVTRARKNLFLVRGPLKK